MHFQESHDFGTHLDVIDPDCAPVIPASAVVRVVLDGRACVLHGRPEHEPEFDAEPAPPVLSADRKNPGRRHYPVRTPTLTDHARAQNAARESHDAQLEALLAARMR